MITGVAKVVVPVDDQERAKQFWTGAIGFGVVMDEVYGDERWIEVEAPDRSVVLVLSRRAGDEPRRQVPAALPHSNVFLTCEDIEQTYAELTGRGVRFPAPPAERHFGMWSMFEDWEGTRFALGQWGPRSA